jgi:uncharacterized protein YndB with AHSA1/START domain
MTASPIHTFNPETDLRLERTVDVPKELVWAAWTTPEHVKKWFTPLPWTTVDCEIDLRPGGIFRTVMRAPEGQEHPNVCCILEVVENEKLVWTSALAPGYRPAHDAFPGVPLITAIMTMETVGKGTRYTATAIHMDEKNRKKHEAMGFHDGWGTVTDQLMELVRKMSGQ